MGRRQPSVEIDEELILAARAVSERSGLPEAELYERALRDVLSRDFSMLMEEVVAGQADREFVIDDDEGLALAYGELRASRAERS